MAANMKLISFTALQYFDNFRNNFLKKMPHPCLLKKVAQGGQGLRINPAFHFLPAPLHADETSPTQLLDMMTYRWSHNSQVLSELSDTGATFVTGGTVNAGNRSRLTAGSQPHKYFQSIRVGERLEHFGKFIDIIITMVRHVSKYNSNIFLCQDVLY